STMRMRPLAALPFLCSSMCFTLPPHSDQITFRLAGTTRLAPQRGHQARALEAEQARRRLLVSLGAAQRFVDEAVLELFYSAIQIDALLGQRRTRDLLLRDERANVRRQAVDANDAVVAQHHH